jgi:DNA-binding GntR family transcriptional regulator
LLLEVNQVFFDQMLQAIRADQLIEAMRRDLVSGALGDGRLTIDSLASRYGVSHMPVREALRELAGEGLVALEPNRGARAIAIDPSFVRQLFDTRIALEVTLAREAARRMTPALMAALRAVEERRRAHVAAGDYDGAVQGNAELHGLIYSASGNAYATALVDRHWRFIAALWASHGHAPERFEGVGNDHRHILLALERRDGEAVGTLIAAHVLKARQELTALMEASA